MNSTSTYLSLVLFLLGLMSMTVAQDPTVSLTGPNNVMEGGVAQVCITIQNANELSQTNPTTVMLSTLEGGSAEESEDFTPLLVIATFEFGATEQPKCYDIMTLDDDDVEQIEVMDVALSNEIGVVLGSTPSLSITITDDDDTLGLDLVSGDLSGREGEPVEVCVVVTRGSNQLDGPIGVMITITDVTTSILGEYVFFDRMIEIPVGAVEGRNYCTQIRLVADEEIEQIEETFRLSLSPIPGISNRLDLTDTMKTVTIIDGDRGAVSVVTPVEVEEGNSSTREFDIVIQLSASTIVPIGRDIVYTVALQDGTATGGSDYQNLPPTEITFARGVDNGGSSRVVTVQIIGDTDGEPDETLTLLITPSNPDNDDGLTQTLTIIDDEPKCEVLTTITSGEVTLTGLYLGAEATYSCDIGYELVGESMRTCVEGPMWSNTEPECALILCSNPPALANGSVDTMGVYVVGAVATYSCNSDYRFSTEATTRTCQLNQMWSEETIACEKVPEPPTVSPRRNDDELSGGAIAGIVIAIVVALVLLVVLIVLLIMCLILRKKNRSGKFKPSYETQDSPTRIHKTDIGDPVLVQDPEAGEPNPGGVAESELNHSNEMLIN